MDILPKLSVGEQEKRGVHRMSNDFVDPAVIDHMSRQSAQQLEAQEFINNNVDNIIKNNNKNTEPKVLKPTGFTIIIKPHKSNPFAPKINTIGSAGLLIAPEIGLNGIVKSNDSGLMEEMEQIPCAKIISVGPECKYCAVGDDIYHRPGAVPVPYAGLGYYAISEQNVICRITNK